VHLAGPNNTSTGRERTAAFRTALRGQGVPSAGSVLECAAYTEEAGATATHTLLDKGVRFTALVAANDLLAIGALEALAGRSLRCPDDVSVTGYNDISFVSRLTPPLTTVGVPLHLMGELAAGELLDWIANPDNHQAVQTLLPVGFMLRGTTAAVSQVKSAARRGGGSRDSAAR
jgi:LacI family transcriptional regulator